MPQSNAESIFNEASLIDDAGKRAAFVAQRCAGNQALEAMVTRLLAAHFDSGGFLRNEDSTLLELDSLESRETPGAWIDRYHLVRRLGEGGFGAVFLAEQEQPVRRQVALKILKPGLDSSEVIARFEAERQALALMDHPGIANVLDAGSTDSGRPYFVMDLVEGERITEYCHRTNARTHERLELFATVCDAIQHAHQKGIIHRDIKPSNVLVTVLEGKPVVKVIDFGIAKSMESPLTERTLQTQSGHLMGTPAYMSPEQTRGGSADIDTRSDIYALGILLYELLTGRTPLDRTELAHADYVEVCRHIREVEPLRPSNCLEQLPVPEQAALAGHHQTTHQRLRDSLRGDLDWVVMKAVEKDRNRRYVTANALAAEVRRYLANEPVLAAAPSPGYLLRKFVVRHQLLLGTAAAFMVLLVVGTVVSLWQARIAVEQRERAEGAEQDARALAEAESEAASDARYQEYVANMNLAQWDYEQNNLSRLPRLLARSELLTELGFEWFYWQRELRRELRTFHGHLGAVKGVAYSPDGREFVTASDDHTAKVWDAESGVVRFSLRHEGRINAVAYSPDGTQLLTVSDDHTARVWDALDGRELLVLGGHRAEVNSGVYSADGRLIATSGQDNIVRIFDLQRGMTIHVLGPSERMSGPVFSPDSTLVGTVGHLGNMAWIWDLRTRKVIHRLPHQDGVSQLTFSERGDRVITVSGDQLGRVWDARTGQLLMTLKGHTGALSSVENIPWQDKFLTGSLDQTVKLWELDSDEELASYKGHQYAIHDLSVSPKGGQFLTGSGDQTAKLWDIDESFGPVLLPRGDQRFPDPLALAISPHNQWFAVASDNGELSVWDLPGATKRLTIQAHGENALALAASPDGKWIVSGGDDGAIRLWDTETGRRQQEIMPGHGSIEAIAISSDQSWGVSGGASVDAHVWDLTTGVIRNRLEGHTGSILSVDISSDNAWIVTGSADTFVGVWDADSGDLVHRLQMESGGVDSVAISPDSTRFVASGRAPGEAVVWDMVTGRRLFTLEGHAWQVKSVGFSSDGRRIITASWDQSIRVWEATEGQELLSLRNETGWVREAIFTPDDRAIISIGFDRSYRIWRAATDEELVNWRRSDLVAADTIEQLQVAADRLAEEDRLRVLRDPGCLKHWRLLGPIPLSGTDEPPVANSGVRALEFEHISGEALLGIDGSTEQTRDGESLSWQPLQTADALIDFGDQMGVSQGVAYAVCSFEVPEGLEQVRLRLGGDSLAKVFLNGEPVFVSYREYDSPNEGDRVGVGLSVRPGRNTLLLKSASTRGSWTESVRLTDRAGNPLDDLVVVSD